MSMRTLAIGGVVSPGVRLSRVGATSARAQVVIYSHGRFRVARVVRVTPTRALVDFTSPTNPRPRQLWRHVAGQMLHWPAYVYHFDSDGPFVVTNDPDHPRYGHGLETA